MKTLMSSEAARRMPRPMWLGGSRAPISGLRPRVALRPYGAPATSDILISIFLRGGMDGLAAVGPYFEEGNYYGVRPTIAIPPPTSGGTFKGIDLDGKFCLHPAMQALKPVYDSGQLAIVHAAGLTDPTRSHFDAQRFMEQGVPGDKTIGTGWIGRHLASWNTGNTSSLRAVGFSDHLQAALRGPTPAIAVNSLEDIGFYYGKGHGEGDPLDFIKLLYENTSNPLLHDQSQILFNTLDTLEQVAEAGYTPANGAVYPQNGFGFGMRQIAQLIRANLGLEAACLDIGGWDTHETQGINNGGYAENVGALAGALGAFAQDMGAEMNGITVVTMSEFGRTVEENASHGTDHGHGNVMFVMGGGVNGGKVYTDWPGLAPEYRDQSDLAITIDYRDVLAEIVSRRLLNPNLSSVFPGYVPQAVGIVDQK